MFTDALTMSGRGVCFFAKQSERKKLRNFNRTNSPQTTTKVKVNTKVIVRQLLANGFFLICKNQFLNFYKKYKQI